LKITQGKRVVVIDFIELSAEYKYLFTQYQIKCKKKGGKATLFTKDPIIYPSEP
jgi:hypothetical protein